MPITLNQQPNSNGTENPQNFPTIWEYISYLIKTNEIKKDTQRYDDDLIHLCGTLKIDSRVKKGLNWSDVVVNSAIVEDGMISSYQYLPMTSKGVKTALEIPSLELYMKHNNYNAVYTGNRYHVETLRISEQASNLDFSSVSANLTLFYGKNIALSHLPQSKTLLGLSSKGLKIDCPNPYEKAIESGCGEEILKELKPKSFLSRCFQKVVAAI